MICEGSRIIFAGTADKAAEHIDGNTEVLDFEDNFIMPGFHDFHVHSLTGAFMEKDGVLRHADSEEEAAAMLYAKNSDDSGGRWIMGGAWDNFRWPGTKLPTRESLDRYFKNTPVFLLNKECHGAWLNSEALRRFSITRDTPDPENGSYSETLTASRRAMSMKQP